MSTRIQPTVPKPKPATKPAAKPAAQPASAVSGHSFVKPSAKLDQHKVVDPFAKKLKSKTVFATAYQAGGVPCRICHGSVKHTLQWDRAIDGLDYDPLLVTCAEGLRETEHPFIFVARLAFKEMLEVHGAQRKILPLVGRLVLPLRLALQATEAGVFSAGLDAICQLSSAVGPALNAHLNTLLVQINKKAFDKSLSERINHTLEELERNGGPEALTLIKAKVPTYMTCC